MTDFYTTSDLAEKHGVKIVAAQLWVQKSRKAQRGESPNMARYLGLMAELVESGNKHRNIWRIPARGYETWVQTRTAGRPFPEDTLLFEFQNREQFDLAVEGAFIVPGVAKKVVTIDDLNQYESTVRYFVLEEPSQDLLRKASEVAREIDGAVIYHGSLSEKQEDVSE